MNRTAMNRTAMNRTAMLRAGALLGGLAVAAGAFGAHGLRAHLDARDLEVFETAVRYQMFHALALVLCAVLPSGTRRVVPAAWCLLGGTVIFSGSLYALVLTGLRWLGAITPAGGVAMILGWLLLATAALPGAHAGDQ